MENQWISIYCQTRGSSHTICQDKTACTMGDVNVIALADGLTSCQKSHDGAQIATQQTCEELAKNYWLYYNGKRTVPDFVNVIQKAVRDRCESPMDYQQMKSTLLFCAIAEDTYLIGHIGDGAIAQFGAESILISPPQQTRIGGTATYTILDSDAGRLMEFKRGSLENCDGFLLTSDGLKGNVYCSGRALPSTAYDLFYGSWEHLDKSQADRNQIVEDVLRKNFASLEDADDCSLAVLVRTNLTGFVDPKKKHGFSPTVRWRCTCGNESTMSEIRCGKCGLERGLLYHSVKIETAECFFTELNAWLDSGETKMPVLSRDSGKIYNNKDFASLCTKLRSAFPGKTPPVQVIRPEQETIQEPQNRTPVPDALVQPDPTPQRRGKLRITIIEEQTHRNMVLENSILTEPKVGEKAFVSLEKMLEYVEHQHLKPVDTKPTETGKWTFPISSGAQLPEFNEVLGRLEFMRDNGLLLAWGEQYNALYRIEACCPSMTIEHLGKDQTVLEYLKCLYGSRGTWLFRVAPGVITAASVDVQNYAQLLLDFCCDGIQ